ncbi:venom serine protease Bi-VSP-like [Copidosoma floridanum]|uniref:venom serine protease Bi-VSP-like n=1 Tax=Copidosoma floridanum TaxID=29053 RepID=UPI000C6F8702|nr:venom serine protease Bi-VSP-like [Copidosoma floridanum]
MDYFCGGSIISIDHIVTAASCIINKLNKFIKHDVTIAQINSINNSGTKILGQVEKMYIPSDYTPGKNDISVLKLKDSLRQQRNQTLRKLDFALNMQVYYDIVKKVCHPRNVLSNEFISNKSNRYWGFTCEYSTVASFG